MIDTHPRENLFRGLAQTPVVSMRDGEGDGEEGAVLDAGSLNGTILTGHFAVFNQWTEIRSWYEGEFLERLVPGAFKKTIAENRNYIQVQFDHGYDETVGSAPLGPIDELYEDEVGVFYDVPLLDTDYNRNRILPLLQGKLMNGEMRGSLLGASFRFSVVKDEWNQDPGPSVENPKGLPERTIREVKLMEFGPVVFPAYAAATAGVRSLTDHYLDRAKAVRSAALGPAGHEATGGQANDEPTTSHSASPGGLLLASATTDIERLRRRAS